MIPLRDENPRTITPIVTYALIVANILVFIYQLTLGSSGLERFYYEYAVVPKEFFTDLNTLQQGKFVPPTEFIPLLTSMFMHGGWLHLGGNMLFLHVFGDNIEEELGHLNYLLFYVAAGVIASLAHAWSGPMSGIPSLGASGAIGGLLGAYIVLHPTARILTLAILGFFVTTLRVPAILFLGIWFLMQSFQGIAALNAPSTVAEGGTAWWAHIGGFVAGMAVGAVVRLLPKPRNRHADRWYSNR